VKDAGNVSSIPSTFLIHAKGGQRHVAYAALGVFAWGLVRIPLRLDGNLPPLRVATIRGCDG
jgi:hypothetical protein